MELGGKSKVCGSTSTLGDYGKEKTNVSRGWLKCEGDGLSPTLTAGSIFVKPFRNQLPNLLG